MPSLLSIQTANMNDHVFEVPMTVVHIEFPEQNEIRVYMFPDEQLDYDHNPDHRLSLKPRTLREGLEKWKQGNPSSWTIKQFTGGDHDDGDRICPFMPNFSYRSSSTLLHLSLPDEKQDDDNRNHNPSKRPKLDKEEEEQQQHQQHQQPPEIIVAQLIPEDACNMQYIAFEKTVAETVTFKLGSGRKKKKTWSIRDILNHWALCGRVPSDIESVSDFFTADEVLDKECQDDPELVANHKKLLKHIYDVDRITDSYGCPSVLRFHTERVVAWYNCFYS